MGARDGEREGNWEESAMEIDYLKKWMNAPVSQRELGWVGLLRHGHGSCFPSQTPHSEPLTATKDASSEPSSWGENVKARALCLSSSIDRVSASERACAIGAGGLVYSHARACGRHSDILVWSVSSSLSFIPSLSVYLDRKSVV